MTLNGLEFEYGKEAILHCSNKDPNFEIENCEWTKADGSSCSATTGQGNCLIWNNARITFSKKECKLTFLTVEIDHGGVYKCTLNIVDKTEEQTTLSKLTKS